MTEETDPPPLAAARVTCPHCWQSFEVSVDAAEGRSQSFDLDCEICCRPMKVRGWYSGEWILEADPD